MVEVGVSPSWLRDLSVDDQDAAKPQPGCCCRGQPRMIGLGPAAGDDTCHPVQAVWRQLELELPGLVSAQPERGLSVHLQQHVGRHPPENARQIGRLQQQEVQQQMPMEVQAKQMVIKIKLKIGQIHHYHPTRLMAIQKVQKLGQINLKVTETAQERGQKAQQHLMATQLKVQGLGQMIVKLTETLHKRGRNPQQHLMAEQLKVLKQSLMIFKIVLIVN